MPGPHAVVDEGRDRRQLHDRLRDPAARVRRAAASRSVSSSPARHAGPTTRPLPPEPSTGFTTSSSRRSSTSSSAPGSSSRQRLHVGEDRLLAEVVADEVGQVGVDELVVGDAVADRVRDRDVAQARAVSMARAAEHRVGAELQRVEELVVDPAVDHVDPGRAARWCASTPGRRAEQVAALDELDAHQAGEQRVLEVGGVVDAGREHDDGRVLDAARARSPAAPRAACAGSRRPAAPASRRTARAASAP